MPDGESGLYSRAQRFVALLGCVDNVQQWHTRRIAALGRLHMEVNSSFTWLQFTELQMAAAPFLPDPMNLCTQLLEGEGDCCF